MGKESFLLCFLVEDELRFLVKSFVGTKCRPQTSGKIAMRGQSIADGPGPRGGAGARALGSSLASEVVQLAVNLSSSPSHAFDLCSSLSI